MERNGLLKNFLFFFLIFLLSGIILLFLVLHLSLENKLESIKNGEIYSEVITKDKLSSDVFNVVELIYEDGSRVNAKIIQGSISDSSVSGNVELLTDKGEIINATVSNNLFEIPDGSIVTVKLANKAVTEEKLADGSVTTIKLKDGVITSGKLEEGTVLTEHIANNAITSFKIADGSITTTKILDNIITTPKLANQAVTSIKLADGSVVSAKIINGAITNEKLANGSVTEFKIADNAIVTAKINNGSVTEAKLSSGSVSLSKLSTTMCSTGEVLKKSGSSWICGTDIGGTGYIFSLTAGLGLTNTGTSVDPILNADVDNVTVEIVSNKIRVMDNSITDVKLVNGSVTTLKIADANVTEGKLQNGAVSNIKLADNSVTSIKIVNGTILNEDISSSAAIAYSKLNLLGSITNADISTVADIAWSKISKLGSSLSDFAIRNASDINIVDTGGYYTSTNVEGSLQEVGSSISSINSVISGLDTNYLRLNGTNSMSGNLNLGGNFLYGNTTANSILTLQANTASSGNTLTNEAVRVRVGDSGGTTALTILNNGNIGINNTSPIYELDVSGYLRVSGNARLTPGQTFYTDIITRSHLTMGYLTLNGGTNGGVKAVSSQGNTFIANTISVETNTYLNAVVLRHNSSGTVGSGFGTGILFQSDTDSVQDIDMASIRAIWSNAVHANRRSNLVLSSYEGGSERTQLYLRSGSNPQVEMRVTSGEMFGIRGESNHQIVQFYGDYGGGNQYGSLFLNELSSTKISLRAYGDSYINPVTGNLGIGNTTPGKKLDVTGEGRFSNTLTVTGGGIDVTGTITLASITSCSSGLQTDAGGVISCIPSDLSLKENIEKVENSLSIIERLRGVRYNWKDKEKYGINKEYGLIAQEVEEVVPELVFSMGDGNKGVKYMQMSGLLIEGIKEIKQKTEIIENRIQTIELAINKGTKEEGVLTTEQVISLISGNTLEKIKVKELIALTSVTVEGNLTVLGKTFFGGNISLSESSTGEILFNPGEVSKTVYFSNPYVKPPNISLTPYSFITGNYKVKEVGLDYFLLELFSPQDEPVKFTWFAFEKK